MIAALAAATTLVTAQPALAGAWESTDRTTVARISACPGRTDLLCAVILGEAGADRSVGGRLVLKDLKPGAPGEWKGRYLLDGQSLPATLRLQGNKVEMKVCRFVFCQSASYLRKAEAR